MRMRPITLDDVELLLDLNSDPAVMRFLTGGPARPRAEVEAAVRLALGNRWLGFDRASGAFIGWFGIRPSGDGAERELGYRLRQAAWGKGLATEGSLALIGIAFADLGSARIWAQTMTVNKRSRRVMERCGLRYVRTFFGDFGEPIDGSDQGDVEYELTRAEWEQRGG